MSAEDKVCALPSCRVVFPLREFSYKLGGYPGVYCSSKCVHAAFDLMKRGKKFSKDSNAIPKESISTEEDSQEKNVHEVASDFGDAGIIRRFCDNSACKKPITLCWKGRSGREYCSNECLKTEKENTTMVDVNDDSPVATGTTKSKKATKKAVPPSKKAAAAAASSNGAGRTSKFADDSVITVKNTDHGLKGKRGDALNCFKDGLTVAKFKTALEKKDLKGYAGWALKTAVDNKIIVLK